MKSTKEVRLEEAVVALFDIDPSAEGRSEEHAKLSRVLVSVSTQMSRIDELVPDRLLVGNGVVVQIGRSCAIDAANVRRFFEFVIEVATELCAEGLPLRTALNHSTTNDLLLPAEEKLGGQYLQAGDGLRPLLRVLSF